MMGNSYQQYDKYDNIEQNDNPFGAPGGGSRVANSPTKGSNNF